MLALALAAGLAFATAVVTDSGETAQAFNVTPNQWSPGNIISDEVFFNSTSMSVSQIQSFVAGQESGCTHTSGTTACLSHYKTATTTKAAESGLCSTYTGSSSESAATIIYKVARACGINPQVILVTLQKEQGLVTSTAPTSYMYRSAMGYGCPDTAACDSTYYGFFNQVFMAARQFKLYGKYAPSGNYINYNGKPWQIGTNQILYNPDTSCGSRTVNIVNQATLDLYIYTPYTPNQAALDNLSGTGDTCSSYGNRNFWVWFSKWFGPPNDAGSVPLGAFDSAVGLSGQIEVKGWVLDPNTTNPTNVRISVDGNADTVKTVRASLTRNDLAAVYPDAGVRHGFDVKLDVSGGLHTICASAVNVGAGSRNTKLGCKQARAVTPGLPIGKVTTEYPEPNGVHVEGWALDPETTGPIDVAVYVDGKAAGRQLADTARSDVSRGYPHWGADHGYSIDVAASPGTHSVCVYAINTPSGGNPRLSCDKVTVLSGKPTGQLTKITGSTNGVSVWGWALDPDTADPISVLVTVDGVEFGRIVADDANSTAAAKYPGYGTAHGFYQSLKKKQSLGDHRVCVYGLNVGSGGNARLGSCVTITATQ